MTVDTASCQVLTPEQRAAYDRDGFVLIEDVVGPDEIRALHAEIDHVQADCRKKHPEKFAQENGNQHEFIYQLGLQSDITRRLCADARFLSLVAPLVRPGIAIYSAKLVGKPAHCTEVCHWHQDDAYYQENSLATGRMSLWLALNDSDGDNGGVWFVPGSHRQGLQDWHLEENGHCRRAMQAEDLDLSTKVAPRVRAGSVVLFHALTWHYSGQNPTDRPRRAFIVSYQDALAQGGNGAQWKVLRPA